MAQQLGQHIEQELIPQLKFEIEKFMMLLSMMDIHAEAGTSNLLKEYQDEVRERISQDKDWLMVRVDEYNDILREISGSNEEPLDLDDLYQDIIALGETVDDRLSLFARYLKGILELTDSWTERDDKDMETLRRDQEQGKAWMEDLIDQFHQFVKEHKNEDKLISSQE
jgi:hypothetical protein